MKTINRNSEFGNGFIRIFTFLCVITIIGIPSEVISQEKADTSITKTDTTYLIEMNDDTEIIGKLISENEKEIKLLTKNFGEITVIKSNIKKKKLLDASNFVKGKYWFRNPNSTRYFIGPSAFTLEPGEGYYQNVALVINSFNVGLTKNISIGGGLELISTFASLASGDFQPIFFITPKIGFKVSKIINTGVGILYANIPSGDERKGIGMLYGVGTVGNLNHNFTLGLGWGYAGDDFEDKPTITLSSMTRISEKTMFVTENWIIPFDDEYDFYLSYGIRFFGEKISVDLGFINNKDIFEAIIIGIPYVDFVVKF